MPLESACVRFHARSRQFDTGLQESVTHPDRASIEKRLVRDEVVPSNLGKQGFAHDRARVALDKPLEVWLHHLLPALAHG